MLEDVVLAGVSVILDFAQFLDFAPRAAASLQEIAGHGEPQEFALAYANATQAIEDNPTDPRPYFVRAVVSQARRHHLRALADLRDHFRLDTGSARAWLLLSEVLGS